MTPIPEPIRELVAGAIDGSLTAGGRRAFRRAMEQSSTVRAYHAKLVADAERLRSLQSRRPTVDFSKLVLQRIEARGLTPTPMPRARFASRGMAVWPITAIAASLLMVITGASVAAFLLLDRSRGTAPPEVVRAPEAKPSSVAIVPKTPQIVVKTHTPIEDDIEPVVVPEPQAVVEALPEPREIIPSDVLTTPFRIPDDAGFLKPRIRLPLILPLRELDQPYPAKKLRDELKIDEVVKLELFTHDTHRAVETIAKLLKARGIDLARDGLAQDRLTRKQPTEYVFFVESLTTDEWTTLLQKLGADDKSAEAKKAGEGLFDKFVLAPSKPADAERLAKQMGIPMTQLRSPLPKPPVVNKSLEAGTLQGLAANLARGRTPEKWALLMPYGLPRMGPQPAKEVKSYLERRGERTPGTMPMILVLRSI